VVVPRYRWIVSGWLRGQRASFTPRLVRQARRRAPHRTPGKLSGSRLGQARSLRIYAAISVTPVASSNIFRSARSPGFGTRRASVGRDADGLGLLQQYRRSQYGTLVVAESGFAACLRIGEGRSGWSLAAATCGTFGNARKGGGPGEVLGACANWSLSLSRACLGQFHGVEIQIRRRDS
jgi:hypothetical protein